MNKSVHSILCFDEPMSQKTVQLQTYEKVKFTIYLWEFYLFLWCLACSSSSATCVLSISLLFLNNTLNAFICRARIWPTGEFI